MTYKDKYHQLLRALHQLYAHVGFLHVQKKLQRHRGGSLQIKKYDISPQLHEHIGRLAETARPSETCSLPVRKQLAPRTSAKHTPSRSLNLSSSMSEHVKNFFRRDRHITAVDRHVGDKLKTSAWNHMRTALRMARQGQLNSARIHANIAAQAVREVAHFVPEDEYEVFSKEIESSLKEIK